MNWLFFLDQSTALALIITVAALTIAMAAEALWPRRALQSSLSWRWSNNLALALITWYVVHLCNFALVLALTNYTAIHGLGLFHHVDAGFWLPLFTLLVVAELFNYLTHVIFHNVRWLWPLHAVHHSDTDVDISTSYRHHPVEALVFLPLLTPAILVLGVSAEAAFTYQTIHIALTVFSHSNVRLPPLVDRYLRLVIVTPDYHRIHHSSEMYFTNSNYGSIVPWFDYLFGTAKTRDFKDHETMELGLQYNREKSANRVDKMILSPLQPAIAATTR